MSAGPWHLRERARLSGGVVAHDRLGRGAPLVHMLDLLGYGDSETGVSTNR